MTNINMNNIKGYPEYSILKDLDIPKDIIKRLNSEKDILRLLLEPSGSAKESRLLLSIIHARTMDYFNMLINDKVIGSDFYPLKVEGLETYIFNIICNSITRNNKLPSIITITSALEIPYSKEFFDEYLYDDITLDLIISERYKALRDVYCKEMANYLQEKNCTSDELMALINKMDYMCTPPSDDKVYEDLEIIMNYRAKDSNILTGICELDEHNAYLQKGQIATLFAYTGSYKTMCCSNIAYNASKQEQNVVYFALEISKELMYVNFLSRHSYNFEQKISHTDIKNNDISEEDKKYLYEDIYMDFGKNIKDHIIVFDEKDIGANSYEMYSKLLFQADSLFKRKTGHGVDIVIIDHLNLLKFDSLEKSFNDYSAINHWMSYFRKNAINFLNQNKKIAILCACQSSREGYKNACKNGRYDLTGIAEGNEIERSSQLVLSIYYDKTRSVYPMMQILKSRDAKRCDDLLYIGIEPKYYTFGLKVEQKPTKINDEYANISMCNQEEIMSCN